jgi:hypothetical protein
MRAGASRTAPDPPNNSPSPTRARPAAQPRPAPPGRALRSPPRHQQGVNFGRRSGVNFGLDALREDTREWWADMLARGPDELEEEEEPFTADPEGLRRFVETEALPWFEKRKKELANRPLIRDQAFGEALDPDKLERLGRYEVHLDRKLERMLAMLLRLKDLRQRMVAG